MMRRWPAVVAMAFAVTWFSDTCHSEPPVSDDSAPLDSRGLNADSRGKLNALTLEVRNQSNEVYWRLNERFKDREDFVATSSKATLMWVIAGHVNELLRLRLDKTPSGHARVEKGFEELTELSFELKWDLRKWGVDLNAVPGNPATGLQRDLQKLDSAMHDLIRVEWSNGLIQRSAVGTGSRSVGGFSKPPSVTPSPPPPPAIIAVPDPIRVD